MKDLTPKKLLILILPFVVFFFLSNKTGQALRLAAGADISAKVLNIQPGFAAAFENPLPSFDPQDLLVGAIGTAVFTLLL